MDRPQTVPLKESSSPINTRGLFSKAAGLMPWLLLLAYALQTATPLRLNTDACDYLSGAASALAAPGFWPTASPDPFPLGCSTMLAVLDRCGLGFSGAFVAVNLLFLIVGLLGSRRIARAAFGMPLWGANLVVGFTLLNWVLIKHAPIPLSDPPFFGIALAGVSLLVCGETRTGGSRAWRLAAAALLACAGLWFRLAGIALLPPLLWVLLGGREGICAGWRRSGKGAIWIVVALGLLLLAGGWVASRWVPGHYLRSLSAWYGQPGMVSKTVGRWRGFLNGDLCLNLPRKKVALMAPAAARIPRWAGDGVVLMCLWIGWTRRKQFGAADVFLVSYSVMLLLWPYRDPRIWLPALPLLIGYVGLAFGKAWRWRPARGLILAYAGCYLALGLGALVYTTRLSFSGPRFPERYGNGTMQPSYERALLGAARSGVPDQVTVELLHRYGWPYWERYVRSEPSLSGPGAER